MTSRFGNATRRPLLPLPGGRRARTGPPVLPPPVLAQGSTEGPQPRIPAPLGPAPAARAPWWPRDGWEGKLNPAEPPSCPTTNTLKGNPLSLPIVGPVFSITITFRYLSANAHNIFFPLLWCCFSGCPSGRGHGLPRPCWALGCDKRRRRWPAPGSKRLSGRWTPPARAGRPFPAPEWVSHCQSPPPPVAQQQKLLGSRIRDLCLILPP